MTMAGRGDRGQSTVEFAMILPLVALVLLLLVQAGLVVRDQLLVSHAAREAARAAAVSENDRAGAALEAARQSGPLERDRLSGTVAMGGGGTAVRVVITYRSPTELAVIGPLVPAITLSSSVVMRVESK